MQLVVFHRHAGTICCANVNIRKIIHFLVEYMSWKRVIPWSKLCLKGFVLCLFCLCFVFVYLSFTSSSHHKKSTILRQNGRRRPKKSNVHMPSYTPPMCSRITLRVTSNNEQLQHFLGFFKLKIPINTTAGPLYLERATTKMVCALEPSFPKTFTNMVLGKPTQPIQHLTCVT